MRRTALAAIALLALAAGSTPETEVVVEGLGFVTNVAIAPDGTLFIADKDSGEIRIARDGALLERPFATLPVKLTATETGLLGLALHPDFAEEPWVYAYWSDASGRNLLGRIRAGGDVGGPPEVLLSALPTTSGYHNGGEMLFGPDGMLYLVTGEAHEGERSQDLSDAGGKVLRLTPDGTVPADGPYPGSAVFASGIRNSFGLCVDPVAGALWETENGPDRADEVNRIIAGWNGGWPDVAGASAQGSTPPAFVWEEIVAPTGCAFSADGSTLFVGDWGGRLHAFTVEGANLGADRIVAAFDDGIVDVAREADGSLLIASGGSVLRLRDPSTLPTIAPADARPVLHLPTLGQRETRIVLLLGVLAVVLILVFLRARRSSPSDASGTPPSNDPPSDSRSG